jgi:hypothetical protein
MRSSRRRSRNQKRRAKGETLQRCELAAIFGLLLVGRSFSLAALADAESRGDERQAAMTRRNLERADKAIDLLESELAATQS